MMHKVRRGLRALPAIFGIFRGVGIWGGGPNPCSGISLFLRQGCGSGHTCRIPHKNKNAGTWAGMSSGVTGALILAIAHLVWRKLWSLRYDRAVNVPQAVSPLLHEPDLQACNLQLPWIRKSRLKLFCLRSSTRNAH